MTLEQMMQDARNQVHNGSRFKLWSIKDLQHMPPPSWLIEDVIEDKVLGVLYGASGDGKSFVALDWTLCIATNQKWQNRSVNGGPVVYVVAEGGRNVWKRIKAWMIEHHVDDVPELLVVLEAVEFTDTTHVNGLLAQLEQRGVKPRMIVIDTLARCFNGDENSSQEMGEFIRACNRVQQKTGATVLAVHHTGKK
jgi:putative DNA primase/helicase